jgi:hypothetical protein
MKNLLFLLISVVLLTSISCSSDADEAEQQSINAQNQMKTIRLEVISEVPIGSQSNTIADQIYVQSSGGISQLNSTVPNQVGQNTITQTFTAAPSSNLFYYLTRLNYSVDSNTGIYNCTCGDITVNIYADNVLFHTVTKEMGGIDITTNSIGCPCPDGQGYNTTVIVPQ